MRCLAFIVVLTLAMANCYGQTPDQFSKNAVLFSERGAAPVLVVRESASKKSWVKIQASIQKASWDVKKTDSLLQPMIGIVWVDLKTGISESVPTKEGAELSQIIEFDTEKIKLTFFPSSNGWIFNNGEVTNNLGSHPIRLPLGNVFTPNGWLVNGFSVPTLAAPGS